LPALALKKPDKPDKINDYLPPYVQYDKDNNILKHSYRSGEIIETNLGLLNIPEIDLFDEANWLMPVTQNSPEPAAAE
jgi:hypothetical protein